jgi:hypothetical protein
VECGGSPPLFCDRLSFPAAAPLKFIVRILKPSLEPCQSLRGYFDERDIHPQSIADVNNVTARSEQLIVVRDPRPYFAAMRNRVGCIDVAAGPAQIRCASLQFAPRGNSATSTDSTIG